MDLVVLGLQLPDTTALEGLAAIVKQYPQLPVVPLIGHNPARAAQVGTQDIVGKQEVFAAASGSTCSRPRPSTAATTNCSRVWGQ